MHNKNWDDFRFVLAVCKAGSVNGASKQLGVNHATVLRRVAAFERRHGISIFIKSGSGYKIEPDSQRILTALQEVENSVVRLERRLHGQGSAISGSIRITCADSFGLYILPEIIAKLCEMYQDLDVSLLATSAALNLKRTEAEIAIRVSDIKPKGLVTTDIGRLVFAVYHPEKSEFGSGHTPRWIYRIGLNEESAIGKLQNQAVESGQIVARADSFPAAANLVRLGVGSAVLPCFLAEDTPGLRRDDAGIIDIGSRVWVASHNDMMALPHIKASYDFICSELAQAAEALQGN